jgi:serpin B
VDVNEEGTEAAAATSVGVGTVSSPPSFEADSPFLFAIRERFSGTILFIGQVLDP